MKKRNIRYLIIFTTLFILLSGCRDSDTGKIITVNGPVESEKLGMTLSHEHLLVDFIGADSTCYDRWDREIVLKRLLPILEDVKKYKVQTFIDATPAFLGRDPMLLKMISEQSGLQIITNTGYYGAHNNMFIPAEVFDISAEELANKWIREIEQGIEGTGIRPGFIKIGVDPSDTLSDIHKKLILAAALTHKATGLVIASHTGPDAPAFEQLEILKENNVPFSSFIWVHAHRGSLEGNIRAAKMGAWISLDNFNSKRDAKPGSSFSSDWYFSRLYDFKKAGLLDHVLISHDAGWYKPGEQEGGDIRGYSGIFTNLIPTLKNKGFTQEDIDQLLITNPQNAFAVKEHAN